LQEISGISSAAHKMLGVLVVRKNRFL